MTEMQYAIWNNKYSYEGAESSDEWLDRISNGNEAIRERILKKEFSFGGRILSNRGLDKRGLKVTYSNCYVLAPPADNIESIWDTAGKMAKTYAYGGGCGISIRNLRPRNSVVHNNARTTTGAVSFMPLYSLTTETIGQQGRRGALMISIPSSHPDLLEFIDVKAEQGAITGANISIEIDDRFMIAVKRNELYRLHFVVEDTGEEIERYVDAKEVYRKIIVNNLDWAEPGKLFWDTIERYHLMSNHPKFKYVGTNPCAEEPLPAGGSCLLGSINLSTFVRKPFTEHSYFDMEEFINAIRDAVIALNEVLDEGLELHPLEEQRESVKELRQIGLGVMGIADMLVKMGVTYGSHQSLRICEWVAAALANESLRTSALIAADKGTFDWYDWEYIKQSSYLQSVANIDVWELIEKHGLRNSQILCIAPTGSLSSMFGISGGIEPYFSLSYNRTTKSLHGYDVTYKVEEPIVEEYRKATGNLEGELPDYFVTAMTLHWKDRINMQSIWQKYIDASISSTVNLPNSATVEETMDLYMYAWEKGLKGCTIYRDGCKRGGILTLSDDSEEGTTDSDDSIVEERATGYYSKCPDCSSEQMVISAGCVVCRDCGFSPCN